MGIWEFISSAAEEVRRNTPDTTPLKNACGTTFGYGSIASAKITDLGRRISDDEAKSKVGTFACSFAKNAGCYALQEGPKSIPGGVAVVNILSKTLNEMDLDVEKRNMLEKNKDGTPPPRHSSGVRKLLDSGGGGRNPEDVITNFMKNEFFGTRFLDDLLVHEPRRGTGKH